MIVRRTLIIAAAALWLMLPSVPAAGHTGLESSKPADGAEVEGPVRKVVLRFTPRSSSQEQASSCWTDRAALWRRRRTSTARS